MRRIVLALLACGCLVSSVACQREQTRGSAPSASTRAASDPGTESLNAAEAALAPEARPAFTTLRAATTYESDRVGEGGELSKNAEAMRLLIRDSKAAAAFQALFDHGTPVARIYALAAFWYLRPTEFQTLAAKLSQQIGSQKVDTLSGCKGGSKLVSKVLEPYPDAIRAKPGSSAYDLLCEHRAEFSADFPGGYGPISIIEGTEIDDERCAQKPPLPSYLKPR